MLLQREQKCAYLAENQGDMCIVLRYSMNTLRPLLGERKAGTVRSWPPMAKPNFQEHLLRVSNASENCRWKKISRKAEDGCRDCRPTRSVILVFPHATQRGAPPPSAEQRLLSSAVPPSAGHHAEDIATLPASLRTSRKHVLLPALERSDGSGGRRANTHPDRQTGQPIAGVRDLLCESVSPDAVYPRTGGRTLTVYRPGHLGQGDERP